MNDFICPKCKKEDGSFMVSGTFNETLYADGSLDNLYTEMERLTCNECQHEGSVEDFEVAREVAQ